MSFKRDWRVIQRDVYGGLGLVGIVTMQSLPAGEGELMKCPYCEEEFVEGYLATGSQRIAWLTEEPYAHAYPQREGDFFVTKYRFMQVSHVKSLYCKKCRIILTKV